MLCIGEMATDEDAKSELDELEQLRASPLRVLGVVVPPDLNTRHEKIFREFRPTTSATTLEEVLKYADETLANLEDLGVFHEVDAEIVQSRSVRCLLPEVPAGSLFQFPGHESYPCLMQPY